MDRADFLGRSPERTQLGDFSLDQKVKRRALLWNHEESSFSPLGGGFGDGGSSEGWDGNPNRAGSARTQERGNDAGVSACDAEAGGRGTESVG